MTSYRPPSPPPALVLDSCTTGPAVLPIHGMLYPRMSRSPAAKGSPATTDSWNTESLRLTVFPIPESHHAAEAWWHRLLDEPPERIINKPKVGETRIEGSFGNNLLRLRSEPMKLTLTYTARPPSEPAAGQESLGSYSDVRTGFLDLITKGLSLDSSPRIHRIAYGAVLFRPVSSVPIGNEVLARYLPDIKVSRDSTDFLYQINRRRPSRVLDGLPVNRLSKWSVQSVHGMIVRGDGAIIQQSSELSCRAEIDVNSAPEHRDELPRDSVSHLFTECVTLADEIVSKGDIP